jgi:tetratricopeptide (TPR) repeat protein
MAYLGHGDPATARGYLEEAVAVAQELGNKRELAGALNALAQLHRAETDLERAGPLYESVVALGRELGDRESIAIGLLNLAMVSIGRGAADGARAMLVEVLVIAGEIGSKPATQSALEVVAGLAAARGDAGRAAEFYGVAETLAAQTGLQRDPADESFLAPLIAGAAQALGPAPFAAACAAGRSRAVEQALSDVRAWLRDGI